MKTFILIACFSIISNLNACDFCVKALEDFAKDSNKLFEDHIRSLDDKDQRMWAIFYRDGFKRGMLEAAKYIEEKHKNGDYNE